MRSRRIASTVQIVSLGAMVLLFVSCAFGENLPENPPTSVPGEPEGWYNLYFTKPESSSARTYRGGPDETLASAIDRAKASVDMAIYDLNLESIVQALLAAKQRGVAIRMVIESDNLDELQIQELKDAGVKILGDRREGLMHNKFTVIDHQEVWTGSMNYTTSDTYLNDNNLIRIRSQRLAEDYLTEFDEMFIDDMFGPDTVSKTPYPSFTVDGALIEVLFSPDDGTAVRLVELLREARESIYFLAFSFTSDDLAQVIRERAQAGVTVVGVFDESQVQSNVGGEYANFLSAGLNVRLDGNPRNMHDKVMVIDGQIVVTGSYNFSKNAEEQNDENTLIIHDPGIAAKFMAEFERIFNQGHQ